MATSLHPAPAGLAPGRRVLLKREDEHELGAFKWRGALPALRAYAGRGATRVVTASTGNHGVATAWAAARLGLHAIVHVPEETSAAKLALLAEHGAEVRQVGEDLDAAKAEAAAFAAQEGLPMFEDGAEPAQYAGYEAIGEEIVDALGAPPGAVVVPVGNGALLGGVGAALGRRAPGALRVGVVPKDAPVMARSWEAGAPVDEDRSRSFADGLAVRVAIPYAVRRLRADADRMLRVSERAMAEAVGDFAAAGIRVEGAAAASLAGLRALGEAPEPIVLVVTGRNIDDPLHRLCVERPEAFPD